MTLIKPHPSKCHVFFHQETCARRKLWRLYREYLGLVVHVSWMKLLNFALKEQKNVHFFRCQFSLVSVACLGMFASFSCKREVCSLAAERAIHGRTKTPGILNQLAPTVRAAWLTQQWRAYSLIGLIYLLHKIYIKMQNERNISDLYIFYISKLLPCLFRSHVDIKM